MKFRESEVSIVYDSLEQVVVARIPRGLLRRHNVTPSQAVAEIIETNQEQPTALLWARNQVKKNNRRRFGPAVSASAAQ